MPGRVDHVINFDFPRNPIDYIHRAGRYDFLIYLGLLGAWKIS